MSHMRKGILTIAAIVASFGAIRFASGEDLTVGMRAVGMPDQAVNRAAKADRAPTVAESVAPTQTISFSVDRLPDTSILVRIPRTHEASNEPRNSAPTPLQLKSERKVTIACEPVVSVLTEIAKRLQPGRCVT